MGSQPIRIQLGKFLWENLAGNAVGNSYGKILWENCCGKNLREIVVEKSCGKFCWKCCGKFPIPISKPFLKVIFNTCNSSRSTCFSLENF